MYNENEVRQLAENHVDWYLKSIRPLLIDHFIHGFKHGTENKAIPVKTNIIQKKELKRTISKPPVLSYPKNNKGNKLAVVSHTVIHENVYNELIEKLMDGHWHTYDEGRQIIGKYYSNNYANTKRTLACYFRYAKDFYAFEKQGNSHFRFKQNVYLITNQKKNMDIPILEDK